MGIKPDIVTDQTSAHDPTNGYLPENWSISEWKDKREAVLLDELKTIFEYIPVLPKIEVGMGVQIETVQLIGNKEKMNKKYGALNG